MIFASGVFVIEHPDLASDNMAVFQAAAEGALRVYESILKVQPESRMGFLDDLVKKRDEGTLDEYVRKASTKCK